MRKQIHFLVAVLFLFGSVNVMAQDPGALEAQTMDADAKDTKMQKSEAPNSQEFIKKAASAGMMEVELGQIATEKASSEEVKEFGQMMVDDHSRANEELKTLASSNNFTVPESMIEKHQKTVDELSELEGEAFDTEYMKTMTKDHRKDVKMFEKAAKNVENSEVQAWAQKTVDVLKQHLQRAEDIQQSVQASSN